MTYDPGEAKSIFLQALELTTPAERTAFLEQHCAGRPELRVRVENLLQAMSEPDSLIDSPVGEIDGTQLDAHGSRPESFDFLEPSATPGSLGRLGGYEVLEVLGRGGMGIVLRSMDEKLNRVVAIKVLAPELASNPQARKRFLREAQAAAAVSHDHVVTIHAVDDDEKVPFLVMECIAGQSLQQKIDKAGALGLKEILRIGMQTAAGLAAAHAQGLVHRDIKPANILLENGIERLKITDFGLARATDDVGITQTGQIAGTPQYMSPEQAMGQPVDQRSDLFSLGSVLYTMCTGRPAFRADSAVVILRRVCDDTPRPIQEVNAEIPAWLTAIVDRLMSKKPEDRFQTANEVAVLLEKCLAHIQQPETALMPEMAVAPRPDKPATVIPRGIVASAWQVWWSERDRWVTICLQTVLILAYLVCMVCFVSFGLTTSHDADGRATFNYRLGAPRPWFTFEVYPEPLVPFRSGLHLWSSSVLIGLIGCVVFYIYWQIEKARDPKTSKWNGPAFMLGIWGVAAMIAVGFGHWQGFSALNQPRVAVTSPPSGVTNPPGTLTLPTPDGKPFDLWKEAAKIAREKRTDELPSALASQNATRPESTADRLAAEWVLSIHGSVGVNEGEIDLKAISELPREPFRLTAVDLSENPAVTTAGLSCFAGCRHLGSLRISGPGLTSEGLAHFKNNASLTSLSLGGPGLTDAGMAHFKDCRRLASLTLAGAGVTDSGLAHFLEIRHLSQVILTGTHITDAGLAVLHSAKRLIQLHLEATDVTADGINTLQQALPQCRIFWSGGVIEPTLPIAAAPFTAEQARSHQAAWAKHLGVEVEHTNSIGMKLRLIPPGEFTQGSASEAADRLVANPDWYFARWVGERRQAEGPPRVVRISQPMYVGAYEVTVGQFAEFLKDTQYKTEAETDPSGGYGWREGAWQRDVTARWHNPRFLQANDHPVSNVTWSDSAAFCEWLSRKEGVEYRLPREAEWEYACRAGSTTLFATGDDPASLEGYANIADAAVLEHHSHMTWAVPWNDGFAFTAPVGSFKPNSFGLFDMHGNVHEWCIDGYDAKAYTRSSATDQVHPADDSRHVYRGGGWDNWCGFCRSADRYGTHSETLRTEWAGFRVMIIGDLKSLDHSP